MRSAAQMSSSGQASTTTAAAAAAATNSASSSAPPAAATAKVEAEAEAEATLKPATSPTTTTTTREETSEVKPSAAQSYSPEREREREREEASSRERHAAAHEVKREEPHKEAASAILTDLDDSTAGQQQLPPTAPRRDDDAPRPADSDRNNHEQQQRHQQQHSVAEGAGAAGPPPSAAAAVGGQINGPSSHRGPIKIEEQDVVGGGAANENENENDGDGDDSAPGGEPQPTTESGGCLTELTAGATTLSELTSVSLDSPQQLAALVQPEQEEAAPPATIKSEPGEHMILSSVGAAELQLLGPAAGEQHQERSMTALEPARASPSSAAAAPAVAPPSSTTGATILTDLDSVSHHHHHHQHHYPPHQQQQHYGLADDHSSSSLSSTNTAIIATNNNNNNNTINNNAHQIKIEHQQQQQQQQLAAESCGPLTELTPALVAGGGVAGGQLDQSAGLIHHHPLAAGRAPGPHAAVLVDAHLQQQQQQRVLTPHLTTIGASPTVTNFGGPSSNASSTNTATTTTATGVGGGAGGTSTSGSTVGGPAGSGGGGGGKRRTWNQVNRNLNKTEIAKVHSPYGFKCYLETPISTCRRKEEDRITYINKGEFYGLTLDYIPDPQKPLRSAIVKTVVMLVFREEKPPEEDLKSWQFWHSRQHSAKQRILDADNKNHINVINQIEEVSLNAIAFYWNPIETRNCKLNVAVQCLSTDFSNQKGVKGLPLNLQVDIYDLFTETSLPVFRGYATLLSYCDKGAQRRSRDEERRALKRKLADQSVVAGPQVASNQQQQQQAGSAASSKKFEDLYHKPCDRSEFYAMADLTRPPTLYTPSEDQLLDPGPKQPMSQSSGISITPISATTPIPSSLDPSSLAAGSVHLGSQQYQQQQQQQLVAPTSGAGATTTIVVAPAPHQQHQQQHQPPGAVIGGPVGVAQPGAGRPTAAGPPHGVAYATAAGLIQAAPGAEYVQHPAAAAAAQQQQLSSNSTGIGGGPSGAQGAVQQHQQASQAMQQQHLVQQQHMMGQQHQHQQQQHQHPSQQQQHQYHNLTAGGGLQASAYGIATMQATDHHHQQPQQYAILQAPPSMNAMHHHHQAAQQQQLIASSAAGQQQQLVAPPMDSRGQQQQPMMMSQAAMIQQQQNNQQHMQQQQHQHQQQHQLVQHQTYQSQQQQPSVVGITSIPISQAPFKRAKLYPEERVLIYAKQADEKDFYPLHLTPPSLSGLVYAIEQKYKIDSTKVATIYKKSKKGIRVQMDDDMIRHYCNEDMVQLEVIQTSDNQLEITLVEL